MAFSRFPLARAILGRYLPQVAPVGGRSNYLQFTPRLVGSHVSFFSSQTATERTSAIDSDSCSKYHFAPLSTRSVVHLSGPETCDFMQGKKIEFLLLKLINLQFSGLVTNDIRHLHDNGSTPVSHNCIYSFMLNTSGRILFDLLIYSFPNRNDELFIEVDNKMASHFVALLKRYKIRRKVKIELNEVAKVFTVYPDAPKDAQKFQPQRSSGEDHLLAQDPRNYHFGYRLLTLDSNPVDISSILSTENAFFKDVSFNESDTDKYRIFRYQNGIAEGSNDFPPETVFPFEANAELLNGVSFQKGIIITVFMVFYIYCFHS